MVTLGFNNLRLTHSALENVLLDSNLNNELWSEETRIDEVFVDLSLVEWCDLSATVRLVLIVERALRDGLIVRIALPFPDARRAEQNCIRSYERESQTNLLQRIRNKIERRRRALEFLQHVHFIEAVRCSHLQLEDQRLIVLDNYDVSTDVCDEVPDLSGESGEEDIDQSHEETYDSIFPLQWFSEIDLDSTRVRLARLQNYLVNIAGSHNGRILKFDPEAIANVIFHELIQNTLVHSGIGHCLVGAWCRQPNTRVNDDYDEQEESFFSQWIENNRLPWIDIAIGDSGQGIPTSLSQAFERELGIREGVPEPVSDRESQILFWSLGRWSSVNNTNPDIIRGTRGLYRVHRLVKAHNGLISLRSDRAWAGWEHGGHDQKELLHRNNLGWNPGTFISIKLPGVTQINPPLLSPPVQNRQIKFTFAEPLIITAEGLTVETQQKLSRKLANGSTTKYRCVIAWLEKIPENGDIEKRKAGIEKALHELSKLVSPGSLVIIAPIVSPSELDSYIDSVNQQISKDNPIHDIALNSEALNVRDVFSLIDRDFKTHWIGGPLEELHVLGELHNSEQAKLEVAEIEEHLADSQECEYVLQDFRQQQSLIQFEQDGAIALRFNTHDVLDFIDRAVYSRLQDLLQTSALQEFGVLDDGPYLSPSLVYTQRWLNLDIFFHKFGWLEVNEKSVQEIEKQELSETIEQKLKSSIGAEFFTTKSLWKDLELDLTQEEKNKILPKLLKKQDANIIFFALARKIKKQDFDIKIDYVVCDSHANKNYVIRLEEFLSIAKNPIILPRIMLPPGDSRDIWEDLRGKNILIYVDIISSGNASRQLLEQVLRKGAKPLAVACLFDSRDKEANSPLNCMGNDVNVFSLIHSDTGVQENSDRNKSSCTEVINALTDKPERFDDKVLELDYPINPEQILDFIKSTNALYFDHIKRAASRNSIHNQYNHFTFYLDINKLLSSQDCISITCEAINKELDNFINDLNDSSENEILIIRENLHAVYLANDEIKSKNVSALFAGLNIKPKVVNLGTLNWGLLSEDSFEDRDVVVFDWNSMTGRTIHRLVDSIAAKGAKSVLAIVWLSRMPADEEQLLRGLTKIRVVEQVKSQRSDSFPGDNVRHQNPKKYRDVTIRIRFLSSVKVSIYDENTCPICRQKERIFTENGEFERYPTQLIKNFATKQLTRPKDIEDFKSDSKVDSKGNRDGISPKQAITMLRFQQDLENAVLRTSYRKIVQDNLLDLKERLSSDDSNSLLEASSLVWLLAVELQWVKLPPLDFKELRTILVEIVLQVLSKSDNEQVLQYAIIVLRSTNKKQFASELPNLARRFSNRPKLLKQLLYDTFTFLDAKHHEHPTYLKIMLASLGKFLENISFSESSTNIELGKTISSVLVLRAVAKRKLSFVSQKDLPMINSWLELKQFIENNFKEGHEVFFNTIKNLQDAVLELCLTHKC